MLKISEDIALISINLRDHTKLYDLMCSIYPPVYEHLWPDKGEWYLNTLYSKKNLALELNNADSRYYFVSYANDIVGILRVLLNEDLIGIDNCNTFKLQRIYLDPSVQGKGIGKKLVDWVESEFSDNERSIMWLEAMDTQHKAIEFYQKLGFIIVNKFRFQSEFMYENLRGMYRMSKEIG
tara:strand:- start:123228 stop:123767 length:540 start_codon:yes stop_codon:yes gene_type:complete